MLRKTLTCALFFAGASALPAAADDTLAKFSGGIGVIPVSSGVGTAATATVVNRNIVRGVQPAGQIWVIDKLEAKVSVNGHITVEGKGLVLGGGNNAGRATGQSVFATLICDDASLTQTNTTLTGVPLSVTGDFKINDMLQPAPVFPCANPVLLIRNAAGASWFATGILRTEGND